MSLAEEIRRRVMTSETADIRQEVADLCELVGRLEAELTRTDTPGFVKILPPTQPEQKTELTTQAPAAILAYWSYDDRLDQNWHYYPNGIDARAACGHPVIPGIPSVRSSIKNLLNSVAVCDECRRIYLETNEIPA